MSCQNITDYCRQSNLPQVSRGEFTTVPSTGIHTQCNCLHYLYTHECMEIEDTLNPFCCWTDIVQLLYIPYLLAELAQLHTTSHKKSLILHYIKHITYTRILRKTNVTPHIYNHGHAQCYRYFCWKREDNISWWVGSCDNSKKKL